MAEAADTAAGAGMVEAGLLILVVEEEAMAAAVEATAAVVEAMVVVVVVVATMTATTTALATELGEEGGMAVAEAASEAAEEAVVAGIAWAGWVRVSESRSGTCPSCLFLRRTFISSTQPCLRVQRSGQQTGAAKRKFFAWVRASPSLA